ncbi:hypothetical protein [Pseudarthrobacter albicanus]|uniref:hypothetical protein n=1 Tax=Pseudarthrobacter albicanus TaxID=2823873 RepID=UPI001BAA7F54|nr:hypothetical protein [Pseudarthrobacter albicanus]
MTSIRTVEAVAGTGVRLSDGSTTARVLARFVHRGVPCAAATPAELEDAAGSGEQDLFALAHPKAAPTPPPLDSRRRLT